MFLCGVIIWKLKLHIWEEGCPCIHIYLININNDNILVNAWKEAFKVIKACREFAPPAAFLPAWLTGIKLRHATHRERREFQARAALCQRGACLVHPGEGDLPRWRKTAAFLFTPTSQAELSRGCCPVRVGVEARVRVKSLKAEFEL